MTGDELSARRNLFVRECAVRIIRDVSIVFHNSVGKLVIEVLHFKFTAAHGIVRAGIIS